MVRKGDVEKVAHAIGLAAKRVPLEQQPSPLLIEWLANQLAAEFPDAARALEQNTSHSAEERIESMIDATRMT
jgi:hypothetical protein